MSTIVYQGLHSYFESQSTTLKLRVATCMVGYETKEKCLIQETNYKSPNQEYSGWSSIQNIQKGTTQQHSSYIHPLSTKFPILSQKSLELCTENLGSETGSDSIDISILSLDSSNVESLPRGDHQKLPRNMISRSSKARSYPPPLSTMRGANSIQIRPYREDGRLIMEAFETPSRNNCLQAERSNGRLILSFVDDSANDLDPEMTIQDEENDAIESNEREMNHESNHSEEQGDDYEGNERNMNKDMDENRNDVEGEIKTESIQRQGRSSDRCKESRHGNGSSCFWKKPLCVATS